MKQALIIGLSVLSLSALSFSGAAVADREGYRGQDRQAHAEKRFERMAEQLSLTDNQQQALRDIQAEQRQAMAQVHAETRSKIASVLDSEQKETMAALQNERRERWQQHAERRANRAERTGNERRRGDKHRRGRTES